jgi:hypothetical protein
MGDEVVISVAALFMLSMTVQAGRKRMPASRTTILN